MRLPAGDAALVARLTVPVQVGPLSIEEPLDRNWRITSLNAVIRPVRVSVAPGPSSRNKLPLVWTRPPIVKLAPAKKLWSISEKMPNWNTGIATACTVRLRCTSPPVAVFAVTSI